MFNSSELRDAAVVRSSITDNSAVNVDIQQLKNDLRLLVMLKDKNLLNVYDIAGMNRVNSPSFNETLKNIIIIIRDYYCNKFREDNTKILTISKSFDIILLSLDNISVNNMDQNSNDLNVILLSFLSRNFL